MLLVLPSVVHRDRYPQCCLFGRVRGVVMMHVWFFWNQGAPRRICRQKQHKTSFSPYWVFLFSRNPTKRFWGLILWYFWAGRARHPGPPSQTKLVSLEFHNVGGWLTHGDLALDAGVDFLAVAEHRLIPARVRSEWSRLKG